jgi:hypothetical protein
MMNNLIKTYATTFILILLIAPVARTANAPVTTIATVGNVSPGPVNVPVTVVNFSSIGAISLSFDYDYSGLHFVQGIPNSLLSSFSINDNDLGNGKHRVVMGWYNNNTVTLSNGSTIMTVVFSYISGNDSLKWYDNGPSCEYADGLGIVLNDVPTASYYINGFICGSMGSPGTITGSAAVCEGQTGLVYNISPMPNVTGYNWTVPPGVIITSGSGTNSITVDYPSGSASGNVTVTGFNQCGASPSTSMAVIVNTMPIANAGNDTTIVYGTTATLHAASGGTGSYNYHWSPESLLVNPNVQNPQTVILTATTLFTLEVTKTSTSCMNSDQVVVIISGGALTVNPTVSPNSICRSESAQLYANAGGGSGNYTYSWTCTPPGIPPWTSNIADPIVVPDSSKVYHLSVSDGYNIAAGSTSLSVFQLPTGTITGGDTLCGTGLTTLLTVNLTGAPPWSFDYSDGLTTFSVSYQFTTPYLIIASVPGNYTLSSLRDIHCNGITSGSALVAVFPIPPTPVISQFGNELYSTDCCGNQWYKDGIPVSGATGQTLTPDLSGHYFDIVTLNSCVSDTSNDIYFVVDGINKHDGDAVILSPNPANESIQILSDKPLVQPLSFDFYSITGQCVKHVLPGFTNAEERYRVDISELSPGIYLVQIRSGEGFTIKKLIVL